MVKLYDSLSEQVTLVIENYGEITYFSLAVQANTTEEMNRFLKLRQKDNKLDPLGFEYENPDSLKSISFNRPFPLDVILVDRNDRVFSTWTEPANYSKTNIYKTFEGLKTIILGPAGLIQQAGIITGVSVLTLRSSMAYAPIYYQEVWLKELKTKSDQEIIEIFNTMAGKGYRGYSGTVQMTTLGHEIFSRKFDSSILFTLNTDGSISSICYAKKVQLINNKLEFVNK